jgi:hypothetical protein
MTFAAAAVAPAPPTQTELQEIEDESDMMTCAFRIPVAWVDSLDDLADETGSSRAALIRDSLVTTYLKQRLSEEQLVVINRKRSRTPANSGLSEAEADALVEAYSKCQLSVDDAARLFGFSYDNARAALGERDVPVVRGPRNFGGLTFAAIKRIVETPGIDIDQLPLVLGLTQGTVSLMNCLATAD